jgi:hypothetical protein
MPNRVEIIIVTEGSQAEAGIKRIRQELAGIGPAAQQAGTGVDGALSLFKGTVSVEFFRRGASEALQRL